MDPKLQRLIINIVFPECFPIQMHFFQAFPDTIHYFHPFPSISIHFHYSRAPWVDMFPPFLQQNPLGFMMVPLVPGGPELAQETAASEMVTWWLLCRVGTYLSTYLSIYCIHPESIHLSI